VTARIVGGAPWTREAIRQFRHQHPAAFDEAAAQIPEGMTVLLIPANGAPGTWIGVLCEGFREVTRSTAQHSIPSAVGAALFAAGVR
jgi:hypothetical protein